MKIQLLLYLSGKIASFAFVFSFTGRRVPSALSYSSSNEAGKFYSAIKSAYQKISALSMQTGSGHGKLNPVALAEGNPPTFPPSHAQVPIEDETGSHF